MSENLSEDPRIFDSIELPDGNSHSVEVGSRGYDALGAKVRLLKRLS